MQVNKLNISIFSVQVFYLVFLCIILFYIFMN